MKRYSILSVVILAVMLVLAHFLARHGVNSWMFYPPIIFGWMFGSVVGYFSEDMPIFFLRLKGIKNEKNISKDILRFLSYELFTDVLFLVLLTANWSWVIMKRNNYWDGDLFVASLFLVFLYDALIWKTQKYLDYLHGLTDKGNDVRE